MVGEGGKKNWGKRVNKNLNTIYNNKPVMFQKSLVLEKSKLKTSKGKPYKIL